MNKKILSKKVRIQKMKKAAGLIEMAITLLDEVPEGDRALYSELIHSVCQIGEDVINLENEKE